MKEIPINLTLDEINTLKYSIKTQIQYNELERDARFKSYFSVLTKLEEASKNE
tara:strand:+ start:101 stop:259 length:159 start_codon:yes stop_codon:yes gene_type:complete